MHGHPAALCIVLLLKRRPVALLKALTHVDVSCQLEQPGDKETREAATAAATRTSGVESQWLAASKARHGSLLAGWTPTLGPHSVPPASTACLAPLWSNPWRRSVSGNELRRCWHVEALGK